MNTIFIKEVNKLPVIFNVDNAVDIANLEALQAVKMAKSMANEVFGNNIRYADNTTCTITDNPDNAEFPFAVIFDASKIIKKPKRQTRTLAGMGMPGTKYINLQQNFIQESNGVWVHSGTAPANGYLLFSATARNMLAGIAIHTMISSYITLESYVSGSIFLPVKKGTPYQIDFTNGVDIEYMRLIYAEGEL